MLPLVALAAIMLCTAAVDPKLALGLLPVFILFGALKLGRYPGEQIIERLRRTSPRRRRPLSSQAYHAPFVRRVGQTAAFALFMRPPPVVVAHP